ncbi:Shikimate O-hydroxycinnamoyltransferase [Ananas comosus]|uniref:Shikimate O-hydroxycinnamoyltransferase n=1 Tax=Ananas comosus TaxID=4615 RepID=A0A199UKF4_ANACO|nr:Shikimate O-hydroxycinnamoyltransferase [Ananas comosus]
MVEILESCLVAPSEETPKHGLWLSNLDLAAARGHTPTVYFYRPSGDHNFFSVEAVKAALSKALVPFYPLQAVSMWAETAASRSTATRRARSSSRHGAITPSTASESSSRRRRRGDCSCDADSADAPWSCSTILPSSLKTERSNMQVTFLKCGGVALGTAMHHFATDGPSAFHFIQTWASLARGEAADALPPPFLDRTLLRARSPPSVVFDHPEYSPDTFSARSTAPYVAAILKLSKGQIALLKSRASGGSSGYAVSTFRAVTAHVWRCFCVTRKLAPDAQTRLYLPAQIRNHVKPPLPQHYFGNALIRVSAVTTVTELVNGSPSFAVEKIKSAVDKVNDVYVRSVIDYLELQGKRCMSARNGVRDTDLWAISWLGMPMYDADFGWGLPQFMARAQLYSSGFLYVTSSPGKDGGVTAVLGLETENMHRFKDLFYEELSCLQS